MLVSIPENIFLERLNGDIHAYQWMLSNSDGRRDFPGSIAVVDVDACAVGERRLLFQTVVAEEAMVCHLLQSDAFVQFAPWLQIRNLFRRSV